MYMKFAKSMIQRWLRKTAWRFGSKKVWMLRSKSITCWPFAIAVMRAPSAMPRTAS
jgi:hypothetical protein